MSTLPRWIKVVTGLALLVKTVDAITLFVYPIALIPSRTTNVDNLYLAHRIVSTDLALALIIIVALVKRSRLALGCALLGLIVNEGLDAITLVTNYLEGNLEAGATVGAGLGVILAFFYFRAGSWLLKNPK